MLGGAAKERLAFSAYAQGRVKGLAVAFGKQQLDLVTISSGGVVRVWDLLAMLEDGAKAEGAQPSEEFCVDNRLICVFAKARQKDAF